MTDTMKAIVLEKFGGYDAFALRDVSVPAVGARQVRVRVHATAINPLDYQIRRGDYVDYVPLPAIIGHDVSGVVEEKGVDVRERGWEGQSRRSAGVHTAMKLAAVGAVTS